MTCTGDKETIRGYISFIIKVSDDGRWITAKFRTETGAYIMVTGEALPRYKEIMYELTGRYSKSGRYGQIFFVDDVVPAKTDDGNEMVAWIVGMLAGSGMGPSTARKIYDRFGEDSKDILKNDIEKLSEIKGISPAKIEAFKQKLEEGRSLERLVTLLAPHGFTASQCASLYARFQDQAEDAVKNDPYITIRHCGLSFVEADLLARELGFKANSPERIRAGSIHTLGQAYQRGDSAMKAENYIAATSSLLGISEQEVSAYARKAAMDGNIVIRETSAGSYLVTGKEQASHAYTIAAAAKRLLKQPSGIDDPKLQAESYSYLIDIEFSKQQKKAVETALSSSLSIITGGPGTGKTTIMKTIVEIYSYYDKEAVLLAPSGKAARRLSEACGMEASTIHHFFRILNVEDRKTELEKPPLENKVIIVDEGSMTDEATASIVFEKAGKGTILVLVGDTAQLPSVGPGAVLRDLIASGLIPVTELDEVFRTDARGKITTNTRLVNSGISEFERGRGFNLHREDDGDWVSMLDLIGRLYTMRREEYGKDNLMVLLPYRKGEYGTDAVNAYLQSIANPKRDGVPEITRGNTVYRVGDPVMHVDSNEENVSNGDTGWIESVKDDGSGKSVTAIMNGISITYEGTALDRLKLSYACTVHKSQGSEAESVIACISELHSAMLIRNIPYVAFSRARKELDVIYDSGLEKAIRTVVADNRLTMLPYYIRQEFGLPVPGRMPVASIRKDGQMATA